MAPVPEDQVSRIWDEIGTLKGAHAALKERADRNEDWVGGKLNSIDSKMDEVRTTLAIAAGSAKMGKTMILVGIPAASGIMTVIAWMLTHFVLLSEVSKGLPH